MVIQWWCPSLLEISMTQPTQLRHAERLRPQVWSPHPSSHGTWSARSSEDLSFANKYAFFVNMCIYICGYTIRACICICICTSCTIYIYTHVCFCFLISQCLMITKAKITGWLKGFLQTNKQILHTANSGTVYEHIWTMINPWLNPGVHNFLSKWNQFLRFFAT